MEFALLQKTYLGRSDPPNRPYVANLSQVDRLPYYTREAPCLIYPRWRLPYDTRGPLLICPRWRLPYYTRQALLVYPDVSLPYDTREALPS